MKQNTIDAAKPFIKWAGGKGQLLAQLVEHLPPFVKQKQQAFHYLEPFMGGGAFFFHLASNYPLASATLCDLNPDLVRLWRVVYALPEKLLQSLEQYQNAYWPLDLGQQKNYYLKIRSEFNQTNVDEKIATEGVKDTWVKRAAQFIFLNKTCFNGLYRVNSRGEFNVPIGSYVKPNIADRDAILRCHKLMQIIPNLRILHQDFSQAENLAMQLVKNQDQDVFIYYDPPYRPISASASFNAYQNGGFGDKEQLRLADMFKRLALEPQIWQMLSNSDPTNTDPNDNFFKNAFAGHFHPSKTQDLKNTNHLILLNSVSATRSINSKASARGLLRELCITDYA